MTTSNPAVVPCGVSRSGVFYLRDGRRAYQAVRFYHAARAYPRHMHALHWTVGILVKGKAVVENATGAHILEGPDYFIAAPREPHSLEIFADSEGYVFCIPSGSAVMPDVFPVSLPDALPDSCQNAASTALRTALNDFSGLPEQLGNEALAELTGCLQQQTPVPAGGLAELARELIANPEAPFSIREMAERCELGIWRFQRLFKKQTGFTPHAFQLACRVRHARNLLRADVPAACAATSAGFTDQSHMHHVFVKYHALTPHAFLKAQVSELNG